MKIVNVIAGIIITALPVFNLTSPAQAASASNSQLGANGGTSNPYRGSYDRFEGEVMTSDSTVLQTPKVKSQFSCGFNERSTKLERKACGGHRI